MKVLVSGSSGFLGRHFVETLEDRGDVVVGVDIRDGQDALDLFRRDRSRFDVVIHCAAVAPHRAAIDGRALTVGAGGLELDSAMFQWAARTRPRPGRVVYFSSSAAYPIELQRDCARRSRPLREDDIDLHEPEQPDAIYGHVKLTGERLAAAYRALGGAVTVVRPFSGYGEDQSASFPFGAFRDRARRREDPFVIWGTGEQVRDWVHVDDVVGAVLAAVDAEHDGPLNISTGVGTSMAELAAMFCAEAGYDPRFEYLPDRPAGVAYRVGDPTLLHEVYIPQVSLAEGMKRALAAPPINM
ncbi:NAD(P)-dependent oxidoreductase [Actinomadura sp. NPDC049382]|uniref:NAD-dependent epimerase/dehydratase family protein n=1 Tax=Actinomadura sp. NPDC049382 TaxID=3158220 RepID=UPI00341A9391